MALPPLPFKVLGQVGPILAWTDGDFGSRLPLNWRSGEQSFKKRERGWLLGELPTYSYDTVEDIVAAARRDHRGLGKAKVFLPRPPDHDRPKLEAPPNFDLIDSFHILSQYFFQWNGTEHCIRNRRMEDLHELGLRLPMGHVIRHSHARAVAEGVLGFEQALQLPELVTLLPTTSFGMRNVVRQGLSESHLHLRAVISAEETWANDLLRPMSSLAIRGGSEEERRLLVLNLFAGRILAIAVLASLPETREYRIQPRRILDLLDQLYFARSEADEQEIARRLRKKIQQAFTGLAEGETEPGKEKERFLAGFKPEPRYRFLLRWVSPTAFRLAQGGSSDEVQWHSAEGLRDRFDFVQRLHLAAHLRLVQLSTARGGKQDSFRREPQRDFLHQALFRYIVCRTHHWQLCTQQGHTTGLSHFRDYYGASQRRMPGLSALQEADLVFERLRQWRGLRVLEGRVAPPTSPHDLVPWVLNFARPRSGRIHKFGLVVHFKKEDENKEDRSLSGVDPPVPRLRWGLRRRRVRSEGMRLYRLLRQSTPVTPFIVGMVCWQGEEGMRLYRLLRQSTPVTPFIVGIDCCNIELATPPEVFAPVFRFLRELPISTTPSDKRRFSPYYDLQSSIHRLSDRRRLGMTYHVGEDFRHLLSGLRSIHEVIEFLAPQPGDRLGHGTALALRPEVWLKHNGYQAVLSRLEWLDTLVWVHHFLGPGDNVVGELALEDLIQRQAWKIYSADLGDRYDPLALYSTKTGQPKRRGLLDWDWSPLALWDAWMLRQLDPYSLDLTELLGGKLAMKPRKGFCEEERRWYSVQEKIMRGVDKTVGSRNAYLLLALYWLSPKVRKNGDETLVVDMRPKRSLWLEICRRVEQKMTKLVRDRELVVEVNPSSNRIIGPMARYDQHHLYQLTLDSNQRLDRNVRVSINTDNPAVCNTTLAHEHYLVGEILMKKGVPEAEVVKWLEWLRQNGEDYCFARQLPTENENPDMRSLLQWLRKIRPGVKEARLPQDKFDAFWDWHRRTRLLREGFNPQMVEAHPGLATRILGLEHSLGDLRTKSHVQPRKISHLEEELRKLKKSLVT